MWLSPVYSFKYFQPPNPPAKWESTIWIGANDITQEGKFVWESTGNYRFAFKWMLYNKPKQMQHMLLHLSGQPLAFSNWYHGEPNNLGNEDCVHVYTYAGGKWNDLPAMWITWMCCVKLCFQKVIHNSIHKCSSPSFQHHQNKLH